MILKMSLAYVISGSKCYHLKVVKSKLIDIYQFLNKTMKNNVGFYVKIYKKFKKYSIIFVTYSFRGKFLCINIILI